MIVCCPSCAGRFRLNQQRLGGKRITLRCTRCRNIFKAEIPAVSGNTPGLRIALGHDDPVLGATILDLLSAEGMECVIGTDAEAILRQMIAAPPHVAIFDVAISGLYIFELVEKVRQHPDLREVKIILLSSVYNRAAYKRTPTSLYGADDYIEKHHLPDGLVPKIYALAANALPANRRGGGAEVVAGQPAIPPGAEQDARMQCGEMNARILASEQQESASVEAMDKARRLAGMIVADIALYSQEKVEEGIRCGTFFRLLAKEIEEGRRLLEERVPPAIRGRHDFLQEAFTALIQRRRGEMGI